ncbi:hypothetical protein R1flu_027506 [Riccia fluitans]|uniref:Uncharacterized protein n=1 Tax=Riccia fluitans TaxID=41844 RepID=A0ABD1XIZ9_9MARC
MVALEVGFNFFPDHLMEADWRFLDRAMDRAVDWARTNSSLGIGCNGGIIRSLDSNMPLGGFYPFIAMDASIGALGYNARRDHGAAIGDAINYGKSHGVTYLTNRSNEHRLPIEVAWDIPFNVKEWQEAFK